AQAGDRQQVVAEEKPGIAQDVKRIHGQGSRSSEQGATLADRAMRSKFSAPRLRMRASVPGVSGILGGVCYPQEDCW
ncbi:hypothetical protein, partial [Pseudomonas sp.]|uniref:hypothetical protein n=1 Tax=Pseudomonas sp. TaxID=306 RepID=UPI003566C334